jgi:hypothetical protein
VRLSVSSGALVLAIFMAGDNPGDQSGQAGRLITPPQDQAHARPGFWRPSPFDRPYDSQILPKPAGASRPRRKTCEENREFQLLSLF